MIHPFLAPSGGLREFATSERCFITELLNHPTRPDVSLARARVTPGWSPSYTSSTSRKPM